ncbi:MAG: hypothetical protein ABI551_16120 [Polyangiaceae bacterium]
MLLVLLSCATVRHVDEQQVRTIAAERLDCDEELLKIQGAASPADGVARYEIDGCAHHEEYDCTEHAKVVACESTHHRVVGSNDHGSPKLDEVSVSDYDTSGCNCGHLFDSHSSSPSTTPNQSVSPTTPAVNPQHR